MSFLTQLTSNTATSNMILPVMAGLATATNVNPLFLMVPATLACSCAFMLPVATPPNAVIFGTNRLYVLDMARPGIVVNLIGVAVILVGFFVWGSVVWGIDLTVMPEWAAPMVP